MASLTDEQLVFAAEFTTFVVTVVGALTVLRSPNLTRRSAARPLLVGGFAALASAAFLRGALIVESGVPTSFRAAGLVALAIGLIWWRGPRGTVVLAAAVAVGAVSVAAVLAERTVTADVLRLVAALLIAVALVDAARRAISLRVAVEGAFLILIVVLAVAVTVSITVGRDVEREAFGRYEARARAEAESAAATARDGLGAARVVAGVLASGEAVSLEHDSGPDRAAAESLGEALSDLTDEDSLALDEAVMVVSIDGSPLAAQPDDLADSARLAIAGDPMVTDALDAGADRQGVMVVGPEAYAVSVAPITVKPGDAPEEDAGVVVVARHLDDSYLKMLGTGGEPLDFTLTTATRVLAGSGGDADPTRLAALADQVNEAGEPVRSHLDGGFAVAAEVPVDTGRSPLTLVVTAPDDAVRESQLQLFRVLFLVALGATFLAVAAAALIGETIGRGLRTLTGATRSLRDGDLDASVDLAGDDELSVLGRSFTDMAGSIRDMTSDLRRAATDEATLRAHLETVISGISEAIVAIDADGRVTEMNSAAEALLRRTRAGSLDRSASELVRWRSDDTTVVPMRRSDLVDGMTMAADVAVGSDTVPVEVTSGSLLDEDGHDAGAVLVFRDVRREREVEDLKASILANIGHELRTPLTPIKGYAAMMRDRPVPEPRVRSFAGEIIDGVDQLERVIRRLITFATISAGNLRTDTATVRPADLAEDIRRRWTGRVPASHTLEVTEDGASDPIEVDRDLIDLAVDELIDNALKYSPDGGPVRVRMARTADSEVERTRSVLIEVTDAGVGFDSETLEVLTDPFVQQDGSTTRRFGGLGLGLACADRIVRSHGGRLEFSSTRHDVTVVTILLPASPSV